MPDLPPGYVTAFPADRPVGLRRRQIAAGTDLWRIEATHPADWAWTGFPVPRYRFDPASGAFRVRYAGGSPAGAARERYRDSGLYIPDDHATHHLVRLVAARDYVCSTYAPKRTWTSYALTTRSALASTPTFGTHAID